MSENYRLASLTSVICKLLEKLIKDHMVDFLVRHKLLNSSVAFGSLRLMVAVDCITPLCICLIASCKLKPMCSDHYNFTNGD